VRTVRAVRTMISKNILWVGWNDPPTIFSAIQVPSSADRRAEGWPKNPRGWEVAGKGMDIDFHGSEGAANARMIYTTPGLRKNTVRTVRTDRNQQPLPLGDAECNQLQNCKTAVPRP
jgi:hypothetical protein